MQVARRFGAPSVTSIDTQLHNIPSWDSNNFAQEVKALLGEQSQAFNPQVYCIFSQTNQETIVAAAPPSSQRSDPLVWPHSKQFVTFVVLGGQLRSAMSRTHSKPFSDSLLLYHSLTLPDGSRLERNCFVFLSVTSVRLSALTFNWSAACVEKFQTAYKRLIYWTQLRKQLLSTVLHQKLGLFHHLPPMVEPKKRSTGRGRSDSKLVLFTVDTVDLLLNNRSPARRSGPGMFHWVSMCIGVISDVFDIDRGYLLTLLWSITYCRIANSCSSVAPPRWYFRRWSIPYQRSSVSTLFGNHTA